CTKPFPDFSSNVPSPTLTSHPSACQPLMSPPVNSVVGHPDCSAAVAPATTSTNSDGTRYLVMRTTIAPRWAERSWLNVPLAWQGERRLSILGLRPIVCRRLPDDAAESDQHHKDASADQSSPDRLCDRVALEVNARPSHQ